MDGQHEATPVDPGAIPRPRGSAEPMPSASARSGRVRVTEQVRVSLHELIPQQRRR